MKERFVISLTLIFLLVMTAVTTSAVGRANTRLSSLESRLSAYDSQITALQSRISDLDRRIAELEQPKPVSSRSGYEVRLPLLEGWQCSTGIVTAYSPFDNVSGMECDGTPDTTSTGSYPQQGTIAVNDKIIPYGSEIVIMYDDGTMERGIAADTGRTMRRSKTLWVDVFRKTYAETVNFGKREAVIYWKGQK